MAFRAALLRCTLIVALAVVASVALACWPDGRVNDEGIRYFAGGP